MPKQRLDREQVLEAAFRMVRVGGLESLTVKDLAKELGCSVQPIYSYWGSMEGLRQGVVERCRQFIRDYVARQMDPLDPFAATGRAYVRLAREEPELFKLFILHRREGVASLEDLYRQEAGPAMAGAIASGLGIGLEQARQLHLDMLIYTVGIGTIFSVCHPGIDPEEIFARQGRAFKAFLREVKDGEG